MSPRAALFLAGAVGTELVAVTVMKLVANNDSLLSLLFMYVMIGLSFYLLSFVVLHVPMGLAYAMWEASGITAVTIIGYFLFAELMTAGKLVGLALLVSGVIIVKLASPEETAPEPTGAADAAGRR